MWALALRLDCGYLVDDVHAGGNATEDGIPVIDRLEPTVAEGFRVVWGVDEGLRVRTVN